MSIAKLQSLKLPAPGDHAKLGGGGAFPQGTYLDGSYNAGSLSEGLLGKEFEIQQDDIVKFRAALLKSLGATVGATLATFGQCSVQYVRTKLTSTQSPVVGQVAFWSDRTAFEVTPDPDATNSTAAGVYLYTPAKGDYVLIVVYGDTQALCKATLTNASVVGQSVFVVTDSSVGKVDGQAAATAYTVAMANTYIGRALETLANGALKRIFVNPGSKFI